MAGRNVLTDARHQEGNRRMALPVILDWIDAKERRKTDHKRQIRIIQSAAQLAIERFPEGLADWIHDATPDPHAFGAALASVLP